MKSTCGGPLKIAMRGVCNETLDSSQVANCYNKLVDVVKDLPVVGELASKFDIRDYTLQKCEDGLFLLVAEAETKIRRNAAHRTSDLLHEVFGDRDADLNLCEPDLQGEGATEPAEHKKEKKERSVKKDKKDKKGKKDSMRDLPDSGSDASSSDSD